MSEPLFVAPNDGEVVGDSADRRVEILSDHESLHVTWSRFGPGREGADLHVHHAHTDLFYVLRGDFSLRLGIEGREVVAGAGTLLRLPRMVVHGFRNSSDAEMRYLNFHAPGREFADYLRALRDGRSFSYDQHPPPADGTRPASDAQLGGHESMHEEVGFRVALLTEVEEIAVSETLADPGIQSPHRHLHRQHVESFYVIQGSLLFEAGHREVRAAEGTWIQVPSGVPHTFSVAGDGPARWLNIHTPSSGFGAYLRALHEEGWQPDRAAERSGFDQAPA